MAGRKGIARWQGAVPPGCNFTCERRNGVSHSVETTPGNFGQENSLPATRKLRRIFIGQDGIRSGWCALLFVVIYLLLNALGTSVLGHFVELEPKEPLPPSLVFLQESLGLVVIFIAAWIMSGIEGRPLLSFGYTGKHKAVLLLSGASWGMVGLSGLIAILWKAHLLVFDGLSQTGIAAWRYAFAWAV